MYTLLQFYLCITNDCSLREKYFKDMNYPTSSQSQKLFFKLDFI